MAASIHRYVLINIMCRNGQVGSILIRLLWLSGGLCWGMIVLSGQLRYCVAMYIIFRWDQAVTYRTAAFYIIPIQEYTRTEVPL